MFPMLAFVRVHRVEPEGVTVRWTSAVQRRKYSVFSPLSLWHLDGNHKLIRCLCMWGTLLIYGIPLLRGLADV